MKALNLHSFPEGRWINWPQILTISYLGPNIKGGKIITASMLRGVYYYFN